LFYCFTSVAIVLLFHQRGDCFTVSPAWRLFYCFTSVAIVVLFHQRGDHFTVSPAWRSLTALQLLGRRQPFHQRGDCQTSVAVVKPAWRSSNQQKATRMAIVALQLGRGDLGFRLWGVLFSEVDCSSDFHVFPGTSWSE